MFTFVTRAAVLALFCVFFRDKVEERTAPNVEVYALTYHRFEGHCSPSSTKNDIFKFF